MHDQKGEQKSAYLKFLSENYITYVINIEGGTKKIWPRNF